MRRLKSVLGRTGRSVGPRKACRLAEMDLSVTTMSSALPTLMMKILTMTLGIGVRFGIGLKSGYVDLLDGHDLLFVFVDHRLPVRFGGRNDWSDTASNGDNCGRRRGRRAGSGSQCQRTCQSHYANRDQTDPHFYAPITLTH